MKEPLVLISIPNFNASKTIEETLMSVLSQTYQNWECIIVDDGSTDESISLIRKFVAKDDRFRLEFRQRLPKGAGTCRNIAVHLSKAKYVIFLDTDDVLEPFCLTQRVKCMEGKSTLDFSIFKSSLFKKELNDMGKVWNLENEHDALTRILYSDGICQCTGVIFKLDFLKKIGEWDESLFIWQDIDLMIRSFSYFTAYEVFFSLPADLNIRVVESSLSRSNYYALEKLLSRYLVIRNTLILFSKLNFKLYLSESKYFAVPVFFEFLKTRNFGFALEILNSLKKYGIISEVEYVSLKRCYYLNLAHLVRLPFVSSYNLKINLKFMKGSSIGKLSSDA